MSQNIEIFHFNPIRIIDKVNEVQWFIQPSGQIRKVRPRELAHTPDVTQKSQSAKGKEFFFFFFLLIIP